MCDEMTISGNNNGRYDGEWAVEKIAGSSASSDVDIWLHREQREPAYVLITAPFEDVPCFGGRVSVQGNRVRFLG